MMELRRFNQAGLRAFQDFLDSCGTDTPLIYPEDALTSPTASEAIEPNVSFEWQPVATRYQLAEQLHSQFAAAGFRPRRDDVGLWAWLACCGFQNICTRSRNGKWKPHSAARWIPRSNDFRRYYRHLVAAPYFIYQAHQDDPRRALAALCQKPGSPGDLVEQLASRQQMITNPTVMQVATELFVDPETGRQNKRGNSKKAGGGRRFIDVLGQLEVTWDLSLVPPSSLRELLPEEFNAAIR